MKSGTTTLAFYLDQHPEVHMPPDEIHFFSNDLKYQKGIDWYETQFEKGKPNQKLGEKTPVYCLFEKYAKRIHQAIPKAKLIWIFRNPVNRAYSHYNHAVRVGGEQKSFSEALSVEKKRIQNGETTLAYVQRGMYTEQIKYFNKYFEASQSIFLLFEDFVRNPEENLQKVYRFLDIDENFSDIVHDKKNVAVLPKSRRFQGFLNLLKRIFKPKGKAMFRPNGVVARFYHKIEQKNRKNETGYDPMSEEIRKQLYSQFYPMYEEFSELTGLSVGPWLMDTNDD